MNGLAGVLSEAETNDTDDRVFLATRLFENGPLTYDSPEKLELTGAYS